MSVHRNGGARLRRTRNGRSQGDAAPLPSGERCGMARRSQAIADTRLLISCRHCHRPVALVSRVGETALTVMATHLRRLHPQEAVEEYPAPDTIRSHVRITPTDQDPEPSDAA